MCDDDHKRGGTQTLNQPEKGEKNFLLWQTRKIWVRITTGLQFLGQVRFQSKCQGWEELKKGNKSVISGTDRKLCEQCTEAAIGKGNMVWLED